jgi:hypothetical protein
MRLVDLQIQGDQRYSNEFKHRVGHFMPMLAAPLLEMFHIT